jgi:hypothetical protein
VNPICKRSLTNDFDEVKDSFNLTFHQAGYRKSLDVAYKTIEELQDKDFAEFWKGLTPPSSRRKDGPTLPLDGNKALKK